MPTQVEWRAQPNKATAILVLAVYAAAGEATVYKCVTGGKTAYQDLPCDVAATESTVRTEPVPASRTPAATTPDAGAASSSRSAARAPGAGAATSREGAAGPILAEPPPAWAYEQAKRAPANIDAKGALDAYKRFADAFNRGDKETALQQFTPAARERYRPILDDVMASPPKK